MLSKKLKQRHKFEAIGTCWQIDYFGKNLESKIRERIEQFDKTYSRFRPDSLVSEMARRPGKFVSPEDASPLLVLYEKFYRETNGAFTPLIGNVLEEAGYDATYSLESKTLQQPASWNEALEFDPPKLKIKQPVLLDFGAAGKGYLVDLVAGVLRNKGIDSFSIDAGGDILLANVPTRIGLENPNNVEQVIGTVEITNGSICGSSGNRRNWGKFHHIINPHILEPVTSVLATWVVAKSAMLADALATCLFFVDPENLHEDFDYLILYPDFSISKSKRFPGELYEVN